MFCKRCGTELLQNAKFCTKCGAPAPVVNPAQQTVSTPERLQVDVEEKRKKGFVNFLVIGIAIAVVIVAVILGAFLIFGRNKEAEEGDRVERESKEPKIVSTEVITKNDDSEQTTKDVAVATDAATETEVTEVATEQEVTEILGDDSVGASAIHKYQIVMEDITWSEAYLKSIEVNGGYLVHINSQEEMDAILAQIAQEGHEDGIFWIGGMRSPTKNEYYWIDTQMNTVGEPLNNESYWLDGEPSLYDSSIELEECYMNMFYVKSAGRWIWNDTILDLVSVAPGYSGKIGYIIEIEE